MRTAWIGGAAAAYFGLARPWMQRSGATAAEVGAPFPGADIVPGGARGATNAITIAAAPAQLWPWLVQMGCGRAGWYSWDRLDNGGAPSAKRIHPEWQQLAVGDRVASTPGGGSWFEVAAIEPPRFLALRAPLDLRGRPFDTQGPRPGFYSDSLWGFQLTELPGGRTRLVVSGYACLRPRLPLAIAALVFWDPAHWVMQRRQLANLKRRAEAEASSCAVAAA